MLGITRKTYLYLHYAENTFFDNYHRCHLKPEQWTDLIGQTTQGVHHQLSYLQVARCPGWTALGTLCLLSELGRQPIGLLCLLTQPV